MYRKVIHVIHQCLQARNSEIITHYQRLNFPKMLLLYCLNGKINIQILI